MPCRSRSTRLLLIGKTTHAAWRSKPTYYAVSTEDRTISPDLKRFMAKRMGAKTIEVKASHLSLISHRRRAASQSFMATGTVACSSIGSQQAVTWA